MRLFGYPYNDLVICKDSPDYLDQFLCNLDDKPCTPHFDNSVVHVTKCDTNFVSC